MSVNEMRDAVTLKLNGKLQIENLQHYPREWVAALRRALAQGAVASPDPKRKRLYELESAGKRFYIDVLPSGRTVILLAAWPSVSAQLQNAS